MSQCY